MKANRKTMLGVALVVAVIALAGIGYAAGYTAFTKVDTDKNKVTAEFVTMTLNITDAAGSASEAYTGRTVALEYNTRSLWDPTANNNAGALVTEYQLKNTQAVTLVFYINAVCNLQTPSVNNFNLVVDGLTFLTDLKGATAMWDLNGTQLAQNATSISMNGQQLSTINNAVLTLTITPTGVSNNACPWATYETAPGEVLIPEITFTLTNVAA